MSLSETDSESEIRKPSASGLLRTDGRTNEEGRDIYLQTPVVNARPENPVEVASLADSLEAWFDVLGAPEKGERWPLVRTGDREPIRWAVRLAVKRRDKYACRICGTDVGDSPLELDHIVPWSAGGSDRSSNLRVLCESCNQRRSNFQDGSERMRVLPVTWWCIHCWLDGAPECPRAHTTKKHNETCASANPVFGAVPRVRWDEADQFAYCAHCRHPSWTEVTL